MNEQTALLYIVVNKTYDFILFYGRSSDLPEYSFSGAAGPDDQKSFDPFFGNGSPGLVIETHEDAYTANHADGKYQVEQENRSWPIHKQRLIQKTCTGESDHIDKGQEEGCGYPSSFQGGYQVAHTYVSPPATVEAEVLEDEELHDHNQGK